MSHRGAPLKLVKLTLVDHFAVWCKARNAYQSLENMIEFLYQQGFIQGKRFLEYVDDIPISISWRDYSEPLREGFIPPESWIGKRK